MDTQHIHMYQRNSNEQGPAGRQRPGNGNNGSNGSGPRKNGPLLVRTLIIVGVVLEAWNLFQSFFFQGPNTNGQPVFNLPYTSFNQQSMNPNIKHAIFK